MYRWIWMHLPGPTTVRVLVAALLLSTALAILFFGVFPWLAASAPWENVNVGLIAAL